MNLRQHRFVTEYLRHRDAMTAYSIAYNYQTSNYASLQSLANRLMNHPEVAAAIHSILDGIRHDVEQEIRAEVKVELLTIQRKREILAKIAAGEFYAVHNYKGKDCNMCTQHVWPTINQVLKAIDLDNKMAGLYSVDKMQLTVDKEKTSFSQQNTTTILSPAGGGVRRTGVEHSRKEDTSEPQQLSEAISLQPSKEVSESQQNTIIREREKAPLLFLGADIDEMPPAPGAIGEVDPQSTPYPPEEKTKVATAQITTDTRAVPPFREDRRVPREGQQIHSVRLLHSSQ